MNLDLQALAKNKPALLGAAAVGVIGLGLVARKKAGGDVSAPAPAPASMGYSAGGQVSSAGGAYDSTSHDLYGALSPQLAHIGSQLDKLNNPAKPPTPVPAAAASSWAPGFYRNPNNGAIYQVDKAGHRDWLNAKEWRALGNGGKAKLTSVSADSRFFTDTKAVGAQPK